MSKRYTEEFKVDAVKQVVERGYSVAEISKRLGVSGHSLYKWVKEFGGGRDKRSAGEVDSIRRENAQLKAELKRVEEERDILKKAAAYFAKVSG